MVERGANMKKNMSRIMLAVLAGILFVSLFLFRVVETKNMDTIKYYANKELIKFNQQQSFFSETTVIKLSLNSSFPKDAVIYYTLNGDDPNNKSNLYKDSIILEKEETSKVYPVKARAYYKGEYSEIIQKTFIICSDIENRFNIPVISLTTDNSSLYDYEKGILVPGKTYDDFLKQGGDPLLNQSNAPTNYTMRTDDWIREANIEMFSTKGEIIINQKIGISVTGGTSSGQEVKSLKLTSGKEYDDEQEKFNYNLYYSDNDISDYTHQTKFNNLKMRNGGQDMFFTNIRWAVASQLAKDSNMAGVANSQPCVVYLNGEYYGIFDLMENYSSYNIAKIHGINDKNIVNERIGISEKRTFPAIGLTKVLNTDLTKEENTKKLEDLVDIDQMLYFYAFETMINNIDWPHNNIKVWNTSKKEKNNPYTDGRYRFLLFDVDLSFMNPQDYSWSYAWPEVLERILGNSEISLENSALKKILQNEIYRNKFITYLCDLMNTSFIDDNLEKVIMCEKNLLKSELKYMKSESKYTYAATYVDKFDYYTDTMLQTALLRKNQIKLFLKKQYNIDDMYKLKVNVHNGIVKWNNVNVYDTFIGEYYSDIPLSLEADVNPGYKFSYWLINGKKYKSESLNINAQDMVVNGKVDIELVTKEKIESSLIINEVHVNGGEDWIKIYNPSNYDISLDEYSLSDNKKNLFKFTFDKTIIKAKDSVFVNCKNNYKLNSYVTNFNLNSGETLYLTKGKTIVDKLYIPETNKNETYGRYLHTNNYKFIYNGNN